MSRIHVDPTARHPLYPGAMPLVQAHAGVQFVTLDTYRGNFTLTTLASSWRAETEAIVTSNGFPLRWLIRLRADDINRDTIDLYEKGVHPPVEAGDLWDLNHISVRADRDGILGFYPWLVKEGFARAARGIEDTFFDYFVDADTFWDRLVQRAGT